MPSTAELTEKFISEHPAIKDCLKKGLINYSALSRFIAAELPKGTSSEAVAIAAIRFRDGIKDEKRDREISSLFRRSNLEVKNNIMRFTIAKHIYPDSLIDIEREVKKHRWLFFAIEGTETITLLVQKQSAPLIQKRLKSFIVSTKKDLSLITFTSTGIQETEGAVAYLTGLFFENGINIEEFMSCYDDTLIVIKSSNVPRAMTFLSF